MNWETKVLEANRDNAVIVLRKLQKRVINTIKKWGSGRIDFYTKEPINLKYIQDNIEAPGLKLNCRVVNLQNNGKKDTFSVLEIEVN